MRSLLDMVVRHQVYLEGYKAGAIVAFNPYLDQVEKAIRGEIGIIKVPFGSMTKRKLRALVMTLRNTIAGSLDRYISGIVSALFKFMGADAEMFEAMLDGAEAPDLQRLWSSISNAPLPGNGQLMFPMLLALKDSALSRVSDTIVKAYANNTTAAETVAALVGDPTMLFGKSVLQQLSRQNAILLDTIIQHISQMTESALASEVYTDYTWISIIDGGTTDICASRNGNVYTYGDGPLPPAHYGCRSTTLPGDANGVLPATFSAWLRSQPPEVVADMGKVAIPRLLSLDAFTAKLPLILS